MLASMLMSMTKQRVSRFFCRIRRLSGTGSRFLFAAPLICLTSCGGKPVAINASEAGVVVRYGWTSSAVEALAVAQENCAKYGRNAVLQNTDSAGSVFSSFYCVKPRSPGS